MSFRDDEEDSLLPVAQNDIISTRAITPSKLTTATRSVSANKPLSRNTTPIHINKLQSTNNIISKIANDETIINRAPSRSTSRRKQRQWENSQLFGLETYMKTNRELLTSQIDSDNINLNDLESQLKELTVQYYPFKIDVAKGKFHKLFDKENKELLEGFRTCQLKSNNTSASIRIEALDDDWKIAEKSYLRIEKRLRIIINKVYKKNDNLVLPFIQTLEMVLLLIIEYKSVPNSTLLPKEWFSLLLCPISYNENDNSIQISIQDSSLHRLLIHGTCQFYGLKSKTTTKRNSEKVTTILIPRQLSRSISHRLSFSGYLSAADSVGLIFSDNNNNNNDCHSNEDNHNYKSNNSIYEKEDIVIISHEEIKCKVKPETEWLVI